MTTPPDFSDLELHNIAELDGAAGHPGPLLRRYPRRVAEALENSALVSEDAALSELRFVTLSGRRLSVNLTSINGGDLFVYRGDLLHTHVPLPAGTAFRQIIEFETDPFCNFTAGVFGGRMFSPDVWRVILDGPVLLHGIDRMGASIRPPRNDEKPALRWAAYGSSITHGFSPVTRMQCYVAQTARRLGVDVINLGLSGSCMCEPAAVEYLASRHDWDFITCEVGVNMRAHYEPDVFAARVRHLAAALLDKHPGKPVVLISPFTSSADFASEPDTAARRTAGYRAALELIASDFAGRGLHLLDGRDILPGLAGLTCDLVHPSTEGHTIMAENLATRLLSLGVTNHSDAP